MIDFEDLCISENARLMLQKYGRLNKDPTNKFFKQPRERDEIKIICNNLNIQLPEKIIEFQLKYGGLYYNIKKLPTRGLDCGIFITEKDRLHTKNPKYLEINSIDTDNYGEIYIVADYNISAPEWLGMNRSGQVLFGPDFILADQFDSLIELDSHLLNLYENGFKKYSLLISNDEIYKIDNDIKINYHFDSVVHIDSLNELHYCKDMVFCIQPYYPYQNYSYFSIFYKERNEIDEALNIFGKYNYEEE